jgi:hypothetical protein
MKKNQQHIVKIFYMWMFCITLKERNTKREHTLDKCYNEPQINYKKET